MAPRETYSAALKAQAVLELLKDGQSFAQVAASFGVHLHQLRRWKEHALEHLPDLFAGESPQVLQKQAEQEALQEQLYAEIGRLTTQVTWLKKIWSRTPAGLNAAR